MNIEKNIGKLIALTNESDDKLLNFIKKKFGSINYKHNGDSLLHLIAKQEKYSEIWLIECIKKLVTLGIDPNVKDHLGRTFLQSSLDVYETKLAVGLLKQKNFFAKYIDANSVDNDGNTLIHSALLKCKNYNFDYYLTTLLDILINDYNFDASKRNNNNDSILDLATTNYQNKEFLDSIAKIYYRYNIDEFYELILNTNEDDLVDCLNSKFWNRSDLLFLCQVNNPQTVRVVSRTLLCIKKLLSIGCNPRNLINNKNFIIDAISKKYPNSYILQIIELAVSHGLKVNFGQSIVATMIEENYYLKEIIDIYVIVKKYGYDNLDYDIEVLESNERFTFYQYATSYSELYHIILFNGFKIIFNDTLKYFGIDSEVIFSNSGIMCILDIIKENKDFFNINSDYQFVQDFCNFITEKYSMNIVLPKTIDEKDVLLYLREYMEGLFEDKLNRMLILKKEK